MTKKYGEHSLDARIAKVNNKSGKYGVELKQHSIPLYFQSVKEARDAIRDSEMSYKFVRDMAVVVANKPTPGIQARPAAAPAPKVHVPKGGGKKPVKATPASAWPFPAPATVHTVIVNGVTIEFTDEVSLNVVSPYRVKVSKA